MGTLAPDAEFARCVAKVLQAEGWGAYTNDPSDSGGPTRWGVTLDALSAWRGHPCIASDVVSLGEPEALAIYRAKYWATVSGDDLPGGVSLMAFDTAVNQGPGHAARWLQGAAKVTVDGRIGPATLAAVRAADPIDLLEAFKAERLNAYEHDAGWARFGHGWENRDDLITSTAEAWATA